MGSVALSFPCPVGSSPPERPQGFVRSHRDTKAPPTPTAFIPALALRPIPAAPHPPGQVLHTVQGRGQGATARKDQRGKKCRKKGNWPDSARCCGDREVERAVESPGKGQARGRDRFWRLAKKERSFLSFQRRSREPEQGLGRVPGGLLTQLHPPKSTSKAPGALPVMPSPGEG